MLSNKRILITGANSGIGISISEILLQNNAKLVLFYHKDRTKIDTLLENKINKKSVDVYQVDLLNSSEIQKTLESILESDGIDGFIHSVTLPMENKNVLEKQWSDYQSNIELQTKSFLQIIQSLIPSMKIKNHGKIISILTSYTVGRPPTNISDYLVAKYALLGLSKSLAVELGSSGISVNCISPSMTNTPLIEKIPNKLKELTAAQVPMGRLAEPIDVASVALFLCSDHSNYITGENLLVSGGNTMH